MFVKYLSTTDIGSDARLLEGHQIPHRVLGLDSDTASGTLLARMI